LKKILPLFSYLLHPLFIPLYGTLVYLFFSENYFENVQKYLMLIQIVLITILIPMLFIYLLKIIGKVDSIMVSDISQRKMPLMIQFFLMALLILKSITIDRVPELFFFFFGGMVSTFMALLLLFLRTKASIHMIGIGALTVFVIGLSIHNYSNMLVPISFLLLLNGVVASSRLAMKAHTAIELFIGFLLGWMPQLLLFYFWL